MYRPKSVHPSGMSWRDREIQKEKDRKEAAARAAEEERLKTLRPTEENFPSLGGDIPKPKPVTQSGMFAKLASEWREHDEIQTAREQREKEEEERRRREYTFHPRFTRVSPKQYEQSYTYDYDRLSPHTPTYGYEEERDWTTVDYKHKRPGESRTRYIETMPTEEEDEELNAELAELGLRDY